MLNRSKSSEDNNFKVEKYFPKFIHLLPKQSYNM